MNNSFDDAENTTTTSNMSEFERYFKFYLLLIMNIPSLSCIIFILYNFKWNRLVSQIFGVLLIINALLILVELPFTLSYLHKGYLSDVRFCPGWVLVNYTLFILSIILTAWASIERYLFIYHEHFIIRHQILLHYIPIVFFIIYTPSFYIGVVVFYPCQQTYSVYSYICGGPCYLFVAAPCLTDWSINVVLVLSVTCIANIVIIIRNIEQRHRMKQVMITVGRRKQWRRTIKLSVQLFSISSLCAIGWIPYGVVSAMQLFFNTDFLTYLLATFFIYFPYVQTMFLPYTCLLFMPAIKKKLITVWISSYCYKRICHANRIHAMNMTQNNTVTQANGRTLQ